MLALKLFFLIAVKAIAEAECASLNNDLFTVTKVINVTSKIHASSNSSSLLLPSQLSEGSKNNNKEQLEALLATRVQPEYEIPDDVQAKFLKWLQNRATNLRIRGGDEHQGFEFTDHPREFRALKLDHNSKFETGYFLRPI